MKTRVKNEPNCVLLFSYNGEYVISEVHENTILPTIFPNQNDLDSEGSLSF